MNFKNYKTRIAICTLISVLFFACESEQILDLSAYNTEPKLTVLGRFEADSNLIFSVFSSSNISERGNFSPYDYRLKNSKVKLYLGNELIEQRDSVGYCKSESKFVAGMQYKAEVSCEGYESVTAEFSAPAKVQIDSVNNLPYGDSNYLKVQVWFNEEAGMDNGYNINVDVLNKKFFFNNYSQEGEGRLDSMIRDHIVSFFNIDPLLKVMQGIDMENLFDYAAQPSLYTMSFDDEKIAGKRYGVVLLINRSLNGGGAFYLNNEDSLCFNLTNIDLGLYQFMALSRNQLENLNNGFTQPQNVPSNIKNGYGYIGGYSTDYFKIAVKDLIPK